MQVLVHKCYIDMNTEYINIIKFYYDDKYNMLRCYYLSMNSDSRNSYTRCTRIVCVPTKKKEGNQV